MNFPAHNLIRRVEKLNFSKYHLQGNILDAGCGNGQFTRSLFPTNRIVGIDLNEDRLQQAQGILDEALLVDLTKKLPFERDRFVNIVTNSTFEHVQGNLTDTFKEFHRVGKNFFLSVPSKQAHEQFFIRFLKDVFAVKNLYDLEEWKAFVENAGFTIKRAYTFLPLTFQYIYLTSLFFPGFSFLPLSFFERMIQPRKNGVICFIWGSRE